jgi:hypothetical protein
MPAPNAADRDCRKTWAEVTYMLQDLAAIAPPAIVCAGFLIGAWVLVRKELAPRRRARVQAEEAEDALEAERADHDHGRS